MQGVVCDSVVLLAIRGMIQRAVVLIRESIHLPAPEGEDEHRGEDQGTEGETERHDALLHKFRDEACHDVSAALVATQV